MTDNVRCAHCWDGKQNTGLERVRGRTWRCRCGRKPVTPVKLQPTEVEFPFAAPPSDGTRARNLQDPEHCRVCRARTNLRKPLCGKHVQLMPYVRGIMAYMIERDAEIDRIAAAFRPSERRALRDANEFVAKNTSEPNKRSLAATINVRDFKAKEIVVQVGARGPFTFKRAAIECELPVHVLEVYLIALRRAKLVVVHKVGSRRGGIRKIIDLTEQGRAWFREIVEKGGTEA